MLTGRRTFDVACGWDGNHAWGPAFVLTHQILAGWPSPYSTVHFVTNGIESAVSQAKTAAAGKSVGVHGADTIQQCLNAKLLDEIHVDIASVLPGSGVRLVDRLLGTPLVVGNPTVIAGVGVTHLRYPHPPSRRRPRAERTTPAHAAAPLRPPVNPRLCSRRNEMHPGTLEYNEQQAPDHRKVCDLLAREIDRSLPEAENKIWHAHPVWFLDGNPTVGYSKQKPGIRLMFWSGADFEEDGLNVVGKKFKDASAFFNDVSELEKAALLRWLKKSQAIQWDYRNLIQRKGRLERLK